MTDKTASDLIDPRTSAQFVMNLAKNVSIKSDGVQNLAHMV